MSEFSGDNHPTGPVQQPDTQQEKHRLREGLALLAGSALLLGCTGIGVGIGYALNSHRVTNAENKTKEAKAAAAAAEAEGSTKFRVGMELGALGFSAVVKGITDVSVDKKGIITAKADTDDPSGSKCIVTYDLRYNPDDNSITFGIPPTSDAAGRSFGGGTLTTPQEVQARTKELCAEQSPAPSAVSIPSISPSN